MAGRHVVVPAHRARHASPLRSRPVEHGAGAAALALTASPPSGTSARFGVVEQPLVGRVRPRARPRRRAPVGLRVLRKQVATSQPLQLVLLTGLTVVSCFANIARQDVVPLSILSVVVMLGGFFLRIRALVLLYLVVASAVVFVGSVRTEPITPGTLGVLVATAVLVFLFARSRERLGVQGTAGEAMLVDLRDRLRSQGRVSGLPSHWSVEATLRSAYGDSFSGDFLVSSRSSDDTQLEMAMVDVSGKGQAAGTRALLLSGAFGGLLGAMPPSEFLPAANAYLLRQRWAEGFATAMHLCLDLSSGYYRIASAGHPPAAHYHAGSGIWELLRDVHGPVLGVMDGVQFPAHEGRLDTGDALLFYTDGLVETPGRDLDLGIDRLMGEAERLVRRGGFKGGADRIVDALRSDESDDRALVLVWRQ